MSAQDWPQSKLDFEDSGDSDLENRNVNVPKERRKAPATPFRLNSKSSTVFGSKGLSLPPEPTFQFFNPSVEKNDSTSKCLNFSSSSADSSTATSPEKMRSSPMSTKRKCAIQASERISESAGSFRKRTISKTKERNRPPVNSTGTATPCHSRDEGSSSGSPPLSPSMQALGLNCITNTPATPRTISNKLQSYVEAQSAMVTQANQLTPEFKRKPSRSVSSASSEKMKRYPGIRPSTRKTLFGKSPAKSTPKSLSLQVTSSPHIESSRREKLVPSQLNLVRQLTDAEIEEKFFTPRETPLQFDLLDQMDADDYERSTKVSEEATTTEASSKTPNSVMSLTPEKGMVRKSTLTQQMFKAFSAFSSSQDNTTWGTPVHGLHLPKTPVPGHRSNSSLLSLSAKSPANVSNLSARSYLNNTPSICNNTVNVNIFSPAPMRPSRKYDDENFTPSPNKEKVTPPGLHEIDPKLRKPGNLLESIFEANQEKPASVGRKARKPSAFGLDDPVEGPVYDPNNNNNGPFQSSKNAKLSTPLLNRLPSLINHGSPRSSRLDDEFVMIDVLGRGEFGDVFAAQNRLDGLYYAVKCSKRPLKGTREEMCAVREVMAHAVLGHHKHIVHYFSAWSERNRLIIQNEYCNGKSVAKYLKHLRSLGMQQADKFFDTSMALELLYQVLKGLKYIHANGLVHLDLKPGNIFICYPTVHAAVAAGHPNIEKLVIQHQTMQLSPDFLKSDSDLETVPIYKIGDFGHVYKIDETSGNQADFMKEPEEGDVRYLASELLEENYSALIKSDIFSLGVSVHELWTKMEPPKNGDTWHEYRTDGLIPYPSDKIALINSCNDSAFLKKTIAELIRSDPRMRPMAMDLIQILRTRYSHALCRGKKRRGRFSVSPKVNPISSFRMNLRPSMPSSIKRSKQSPRYCAMDTSLSEGCAAKPLKTSPFDNVSAGGDSTEAEVSELRAEIVRLKQQLTDKEKQIKSKDIELKRKDDKVKELQGSIQKLRRRR